MKLSLYFFLPALAISSGVNAQKEFLVTFDNTKATYQLIDSIPGVEWIQDGASALDEVDHYLFFFGNHTAIAPWYLYVVDAFSGAILTKSMVRFQSDSIGPFFNLEYDNSLKKLFCIYSTKNGGYLASISPQTGVVSIINAIPDLGGIGSATYDQNHHRYIFLGLLSGDKNRIISLDVSSGNIVSSPALWDNSGFINLNSPIYCNSTNTLYGIRIVNEGFYFVSINPENAEINVISGKLPVQDIYSSDFSSMDESSHHYVFAAHNDSGIARLYTLNMDNGQIIWNPSYKYATNSYNLPNVIEFHFDNSNGKLYALHWGNDSTRIDSASSDTIVTANDCLQLSDISIAPNPFHENALIDLHKVISDLGVNLYDGLGRLMESRHYKNVSSFRLSPNYFPQAMYFLTFFCNQKFVGCIPVNIE